jgi:transcriptional regulator with XRE-family HTH domain
MVRTFQRRRNAIATIQGWTQRSLAERLGVATNTIEKPAVLTLLEGAS